MENNFIMTDTKWQSGIQLDEYNEKYSLVAAYQGKDNGKIYQKWCFAQTKDKKPSDKPMPWKLDLGNREQAIEILQDLLAHLGVQVAGPEVLPDSVSNIDPGEKDIPF